MEVVAGTGVLTVLGVDDDIDDDVEEEEELEGEADDVGLIEGIVVAVGASVMTGDDVGVWDGLGLIILFFAFPYMKTVPELLFLYVEIAM